MIEYSIKIVEKEGGRMWMGYKGHGTDETQKEEFVANELKKAIKEFILKISSDKGETLILTKDSE